MEIERFVAPILELHSYILCDTKYMILQQQFSFNINSQNGLHFPYYHRNCLVLTLQVIYFYLQSICVWQVAAIALRDDRSKQEVLCLIQIVERVAGLVKMGSQLDRLVEAETITEPWS